MKKPNIQQRKCSATPACHPLATDTLPLVNSFVEHTVFYVGADSSQTLFSVRRHPVSQSGKHNPESTPIFCSRLDLGLVDSSRWPKILKHYRRLGSLLNPPDIHRRPRRLLVHLNTEVCAQELLKAAKNLRRSTDQTARSVYINRDLDPAAAKLEYEKRVRSRQKQQQEQKKATARQSVRSCIFTYRVFTVFIFSSSSHITA